MWIRRLRTRGVSGPEIVNVLWKHDEHPLYLMDNHRAAFWCWRAHLAPNEAYRLLHVDWHWDALDVAPGDVAILRKHASELDDFAFFDGLRSGSVPRGQSRAPRLIRWDNYIDAFLALHPRLAGADLVAHQGTTRVRGRVRRAVRRGVARIRTFPAFCELLTDVGGDKEPLIVNFDLDFFFAAIRGRTTKAFDLGFVREIFRNLARALPRLRVMTIALSPECCGGWSAAERVGRAAFDGLRIQYPLPRRRRLGSL